MSKKKLRDKVIMGIAIVALFIAIIYQFFADKQDILEQIRQGEPDTAKIESLGGDYPSYKLWNTNGNFLGYAVIAGSSGYGGKLSVLTVIQETGQIKSVSLLENHETPTYLKKILNSGILRKITNQNIKDNLSGIDAVSGATVTSEAIIAAAQKGNAQIGNRQLGLQIPDNQKINFTWKDIAALGLLLSAVCASALKARKLRPWLLALAVLFIGFLGNYSLTYGSFIGLLSGNLPVFSERPIWYAMVPGILIITLVWGKNFYCSWLCPFGAVQEGLYHSLNLFEFSSSPGIKSKIAGLRWPVCWLAAMLALLFNNGQIAGYEPFAVFFNASGNTAQWIIVMIIVGVSITQIRFWCNTFCPVGFILNFLARLKGKLQRLIRKNKTKLEEQGILSPCQECSNQDCPVVIKPSKESLGKQDKIFAGIAIIVNLLILLALIENILLISQN